MVRFINPGIFFIKRGLEDKTTKNHEIKGLRIEVESEAKDSIRNPKNPYEKKPLYERLQEETNTDYDTWCRHSD